MGNIREESDRIFLSGAYSSLPPIHTVGAQAPGNGMATLEVKNDTVYTLTTLFSGPIDQRLEVAPGRFGLG
jgi:hypothetical protein